MTERGVVYIALGARAEQELTHARKALERRNDYPVYVIYPPALKALKTAPGAPGGLPESDHGLSRWAKVNLDRLAPWDTFCYLDVDTRVQAPLNAGFDLLDKGWDVVLAPSDHQGREAYWHVGEEERRYTREVAPDAIQFQAGVMFVRKSERTRALWRAWREEWLRWQGEDQAALVRAIHRSPAAVMLLGKPWNGGAAIQHLFGRTRS